jgi:putative addiction module component (TIGR02574 family)
LFAQRPASVIVIEDQKMDMATALNEILNWPPDDQLEFVQRAWDQLVDSGWRPQLTEDQKMELSRRLADPDPGNVVTWDSIVEHVRRKQ